MDGTVFQCNPVFPLHSVAAFEYGERGADTLLLIGFDRPVIANQRITTLLEVYGIDAAIVVGRFDELQLAPSLAIIPAEGDTDVATTGATKSLQTTIGQHEDGRLDGFHALFRLHECRALPRLTHIVAILEIQFPPVTLVTGGRDEATLVEDGLVLDGSIDGIGQLFAFSPSLSTILGTHHPTLPSRYIHANLEINA